MAQRWFKFDDEGDRDLGEQLRGLGPLLTSVKGRTVLDVGCAEGLISLALLERGAAHVHGVEIVTDHVRVARQVAYDRGFGYGKVAFDYADANEYRPKRHYDVLLMLAVLHKLKAPVESCLSIVYCATPDLVVVRLPPDGAPPKKIAGRGECSTALITAALAGAGYRLTQTTPGPREEWTAYFEKGV